MLIIDKRLTPTHSRRVEGKYSTQRVVSSLLAQSVSFYCEPYPGDEWRVTVNHEARHILDELIDGA